MIRSSLRAAARVTALVAALTATSVLSAFAAPPGSGGGSLLGGGSDHVEIDQQELYDIYRRAVMLLLAIPVGGGAKLDLANDRALELFEVILSRSLAAIEDLGALDTMP